MSDRRLLTRISLSLKRARTSAARLERYAWIGAVAVVLWVQWPMLKGVYYQRAGIPAPSTDIVWRTDLDAALVEARLAGKDVLVDFSADWCPPCIAMKHDVWPDAAVRSALTESYVPVLIDVDRNDVVPDRYGVRGIPTVLILDSAGQVRKEATFLTASRMAAFLRTAE
jgi:thiol:disulfide interchange protein